MCIFAPESKKPDSHEFGFFDKSNIMTRNQGITDNILKLVGETPLIKLHRITKDFKGAYYAKLEAFNPGHSAKDRIADINSSITISSSVPTPSTRSSE